MREQILILSSSGSSPAEWWLSLPLSELREWIDAHNRICERQRKKE